MPRERGAPMLQLVRLRVRGRLDERNRKLEADMVETSSVQRVSKP